MPDVGQQLSAFKAPASTGQTVELDAYLGKVPIVLFFVPDVEREASREEIDAWSEHLVDFGHRRVQVLGVVPATPREIRQATHEWGWVVPLLADEGHLIGEELGVTSGSADAPTLVADRDGTIVEIVAREGDGASHARAVLGVVERLHLEAVATAPGVGDPG
jgi:peroxiredoxin